MKNAIQTNLSAYIKIFLMIFIIIFILPLFAACDKTPQHTDVPNTAPSGPTQEEVSATIESLLSQYEVEDVTAQDVAESYAGEGEELLVAKLEDDGRLKMVFKANGNLYSKIVTLPQTAKNVLTNGWESYVLSKIADYDLYSVVFGQKEIDKLKVTIQNAIAEYQEEVESYQGLTTKRLSYGKSSYEDNGALQKKVSEKLLAYQYHEVREDESFVIIGVDESGRVIEYLVQMNELVGGDVYERFINGVEGEDYTVTQREVDPSKPYAAPAEREIVTFEELYNSVFGENFEFKPYKEVLEELVIKKTSAKEVNLIAIGYENGTFNVFADILSNSNYYNFISFQYIGKDGQFDDAINTLFELQNLYGKDLEIFKKENKNKKFIVDSENYELLNDEIGKIKEAQSQLDYFDNIDLNDVKLQIRMLATNDNSNYNAFGEQYLKVTGKTDAQLISAYVGDMSTHLIDSKLFNTGYACYFDMAGIYLEGDSLNVYKTQVAVPWYNDSTNDSLYNSFLNDVEFKLRGNTITLVEDAHLLLDVPEQEKQIDPQEFKIDEIIDERRLG